jgi:hypothetical protein
VFRVEDGLGVYTLHGHCGPITAVFIDRFNQAPTLSYFSYLFLVFSGVYWKIPSLPGGRKTYQPMSFSGKKDRGKM